MNRVSLCCIGESNKDIEFEKLIDSVHNCSLCPDMEARTGVLSELNGNIHSNVLFVAEAPGRLGADKTRIPLFGDQTGINFQRLIDTIEWSREDLFITNSVLCNPRDDLGNNTTPCKKHIKNCSLYLKILINIMNPEYVVTLGLKAIEALNTIEEVKISLKTHVRTSLNWSGRTVIPLYHMGPRALIHRSFYNQLSDFYWLKHTVKLNARPWERLRKSPLKKTLSALEFSPTKLQKLIIEILMKTGPISEFKLTKLIYLIDYYYLKEYNKILTNSYYIRAYAGPLPVGLGKQLDQLRQQNIIKKQKYISLTKLCINDFPAKDLKTIDQIINKYADKSDSEVKTSTYLTVPMKRILKAEKQLKEMMLWKSVFTAEDFKK